MKKNPKSLKQVALARAAAWVVFAILLLAWTALVLAIGQRLIER